MNLIAPADEWLDALHAALDAARGLKPDGLGMVGYGVAHLLDGDGKTKQLVPFHNLITTAGDQYYALRAAAGISPQNPSQPTNLANGMKLGSSTTNAPSKSGAGAVINTFVSGSNVVFDATYPQTAAVGSDIGWNVTYKTTWAAGTATFNGIIEVAVVTDQATATAGTAAATLSRAAITSVNKTSTDSLAVTYNHKFFGA